MSELRIGGVFDMADHWAQCVRRVAIESDYGNGDYLVSSTDGVLYVTNVDDLFPVGESPYREGVSS